MKLASLGVAARSAEARALLVRLRDRATLEVTLDRERQDEVMVALVRPIVVAELDRRIADVEADLAALGVELG